LDGESKITTAHNFPEFESDFSKIKIADIPARRTLAYARSLQNPTLNIYGSLFLGASKNLLKRSQSELLDPLGRLGNFIEGDDSEDYIDWAELKRNQRGRHLVEYWEKKRLRQKWMKELRPLYPHGRKQNTDHQDIDPTILSFFITPFSQGAHTRQQFDKQLSDLLKMGRSHLLPWRAIISLDIKKGANKFNSLSKVIGDKKRDTTLKFQYMLELAHYGQIEITQTETFGDIEITPKKDANKKVTVKDRDGRQYRLTWRDLTDTQRHKVIQDLKDGRVVMS